MYEERKIQLKELSGTLYGAVAIPKKILESWIADGVTHVGFDYAETDNILKVSPLKFETARGI